MKKKLITRILSMSILLFVSLFASISYGWFVGFWTNNNSKLGFRASEPDDLVVHAWTYKTSSYDSGSNKWVEETLDNSHDEMVIFPHVVTTNSGYKFTLSSLQLGVVDNLVKLGEDNIYYFMIEIKEEEHGSTVDMTVGLDDGNYVDIYDNEGTDVSSTYRSDLLTKMSDGDEDLLKFAYCVATTSSGAANGKYYIPGEDGFSNYVFTDIPTENKEITELDLELTEGSTGYLFIEIYVNLDAMAIATEVLTDIMPVIMLFNVDLEFSFYNKP